MMVTLPPLLTTLTRKLPKFIFSAIAHSVLLFDVLFRQGLHSYTNRRYVSYIYALARQRS